MPQGIQASTARRLATSLPGQNFPSTCSQVFLESVPANHTKPFQVWGRHSWLRTAANEGLFVRLAFCSGALRDNAALVRASEKSLSPAIGGRFILPVSWSAFKN